MRFVPLIQKTFEAGPKNRPRFSQGAHNLEHSLVSKTTSYIYKMNLKIFPKKYSAQQCLTLFRLSVDQKKARSQTYSRTGWK